MAMFINRILPPAPERSANPTEPLADPERDRLFDVLDTLRHESFALQNQLFKVPQPERTRLKRLLDENRAAQTELCDALSTLRNVL